MNVAALLHDSPSNPPRKPPQPEPLTRNAPTPPPSSTTLPPHHSNATSPAMSSLRPNPNESKPLWPKDHDDVWEKDRRTRPESGPLPSMRSTPLDPIKPYSQRDMDDMDVIRASASTRQQPPVQQQPQGPPPPTNYAELLVIGPAGTAPRPSSSSSARNPSSLLGVGAAMERDREMPWDNRIHHSHFGHQRLPPAPAPGPPHHVRSMAAPIPMHPREPPFDQQQQPLQGPPHSRPREYDDALRMDVDMYDKQRPPQRNLHPVPHHTINIRHGLPPRTSSAGLMEGRLLGGPRPVRGRPDERQEPFHHREPSRESDYGRRHKQREKDKLKKEVIKEVRPVPVPIFQRSLLGSARRSLGVAEDIDANLFGIDPNAISVSTPDPVSNTVHLGTYVFPKTPFPFSFPTRRPAEPTTFTATIYIPSGHLPLQRPERPQIWGGGASTKSTRVKTRVYTDDSDLFLCALHAGFVTWSGARKARAAGQDLKVHVRLVRCLRDKGSAWPGEHFVGLFLGGWGERYRSAEPKNANGQPRRKRNITKGDDDSVVQPKRRIEELRGDGEESEDEDDGRSLASAGWGSSHDGSGIEIVNAEFVTRATARRLGRLNRRQRLAEYNQRRAALVLEDAPRTIVFGQTGEEEDLCPGFKYDAATLKHILFYEPAEEQRPAKRRKVTNADEPRTVAVETVSERYLFCRRDEAVRCYDIAIVRREVAQPPAVEPPSEPTKDAPPAEEPKEEPKPAAAAEPVPVNPEDEVEEGEVIEGPPPTAASAPVPAPEEPQPAPPQEAEQSSTQPEPEPVTQPDATPIEEKDKEPEPANNLKVIRSGLMEGCLRFTDEGIEVLHDNHESGMDVDSGPLMIKVERWRFINLDTPPAV